MLVYGRDGHSLTSRRNPRAGGGGFGVPPPSVSGRNWSLFIIASFLFEQSGIDEAVRKHAIAANPQNTALRNATSVESEVLQDDARSYVSLFHRAAFPHVRLR